MTEYRYIKYSVIDNVARIALNDPERLNATSEAMNQELLDALYRASDVSRAIVLTGEGRAFCAGANLEMIEDKLADSLRDIGRSIERSVNLYITAVKNINIPVISAVRGVAAGVGAGFALASDIVVCGEDSNFLFAFSKVGLGPDGGVSWLLARSIGRTRAMHVLLCGKKLPAVQALDWGLISEVVPDAEVEDRAFEIARELASGPLSIGLIKRQVWQAADDDLERALSSERFIQQQACRSMDFVEGVAAFRNKRKPIFQGR